MEKGHLVSTGPDEKLRLLVEDGCYPRLAGDRLFFVRKDEIWAARIGSSGELVTAPVATGIRVFRSWHNGPPHYDLSDNGTLFYLDSTPASDLYTFDRYGRRTARIPLAKTLPGGDQVRIEVSPDGQRALVSADRALQVVQLKEGQVGRTLDFETAVWIDNDTFAAAKQPVPAIVILDSEGRPIRTLSLLEEGPGQDTRLLNLSTWVDAVDPSSGDVLATVHGDLTLLGQPESEYGPAIFVLDPMGETPPRVRTPIYRNEPFPRTVL